MPSFSDQRLWLAAGSVVTIKSHSKQEKCVCVSYPPPAWASDAFLSVSVHLQTFMCLASLIATQTRCGRT